MQSDFPDSWFPYEDAWGSAQLLQAMAEAEDAVGLAVVWHLRDPAQATPLLPLILDSDDERLGGLVADEIVAPGLAHPFSTTLTQHLTSRQKLPPLSEQATTRLLELLNDPQGLTAVSYEPARGAISCWVLQQEGPQAEEFALAVLDRAVPGAEDAAVRSSALNRVARSRFAFEKAVDAQLQRLDEEPPRPGEWEEGQLLFVAGTREDRAKGVLSRLGDKLIRLAPALGPSAELADELAAYVRDGGAKAALATLETPPGAQPGLGALAAAGLGADSNRKLDFFSVIAHYQSGLWPSAVTGYETWSLTEWRNRLRALDTNADDTAIQWVIDNAPPSMLKTIITLAVETGRSRESDALPEAMGARIAQMREAAAENQAAAELAAAKYDDALADGPEDPDLLADIPLSVTKSCLAEIRTVLHQALAPENQAQLAADAFAGGKINTETVVALVPEGHEEAALRQLPSGDARGKLATALLSARKDETLMAIQSVQGDAFAVDLARASTIEPSVAFNLGDGVYQSLSAADRDELLTLLETHGTDDEIPLLDMIMGDGHKSAAPRRIRAADRVGELAEPRGTVPGGLVKMLEAGNAEVCKAAIRNIEKIRPRDMDTITKLRTITVGVPGKLSASALDAIADDIADDLAQHQDDREHALALLPILGRTGRASVFQTLFRFVGADAEWQDPEARRTAAAAIADAAEGIKEVSVDDQTALAELLDGEAAEVDPSARDDLNDALSLVLLGEDAALAVLYKDFLPKFPQSNPDQIFGAEKHVIVTHLGLYKRAADRHERGRQLTQLDIVAAAIARATYLHYGPSQAIKEDIKATYKQKDYASLIKSIGNTPDMKNIQGSLQVIHDLRCDKGQEAHPGEEATDNDVVAAKNAFETVARHCLGLLRPANGLS